ncbi:hypothetical protein NC99_16880 [Sunxiuqinia dokdonensis]|uniref:Uncharacterized protein n=1 Tax=Sunxiuqinia dokdonensis TaxID=1409788 RepID=A0A0L8VAU3_9BACT|nr:hypothetical protein NC99_16880 [Sunxiuqinia dokdonensis]
MSLLIFGDRRPVKRLFLLIINYTFRAKLLSLHCKISNFMFTFACRK